MSAYFVVWTRLADSLFRSSQWDKYGSLQKLFLLLLRGNDPDRVTGTQTVLVIGKSSFTFYRLVLLGLLQVAKGQLYRSL